MTDSADRPTRDLEALTLEASEESFRLIVETIPGLIAVMTAEGGVEHVNHQVLDYFGRTLEELQRWGTTDAVHPADLPQVRAAWQHAVQTGLPYEFEHRIRRADGEYQWFQSRGLPLRNAEGRIVRWYNLLTDIDARKQSEEMLRRSEADLLEAQRLSHAGSWRHDLASGTFTVSPEVLRIRGVESAEPLSTIDRMYSGIHPEDRSRVRHTYEAAQMRKGEFDAEYRIVLGDGTVKHLHTIGHPVLNGAGDVVEYVHSQALASGRAGLCQSELRGNSTFADRVRVVRSRKRRLHGGGSAAPRPF